MTIAEITELGGLIVAGISLAITIIKLVKELKEKNLKKEIERLMVEAEEKEMSGERKLNYVILGLYETYGKPFKKLEEQAKSYIEECIDFSKKINSK